MITPKMLDDALNRLAKWRTIFAGWQLGTRSKEDPEAQAVRDQREAMLLMRVEISALLNLCLKKRLFTAQELNEQIYEEATILNERLEKRFTGCRTDLDGVHIDIEKALPWMKNFRP